MGLGLGAVDSTEELMAGAPVSTTGPAARMAGRSRTKQVVNFWNVINNKGYEHVESIYDFYTFF